ncbi:hypothetical protein I79_012682 [Cricetulus griseus]|uniref:Uncharacterized protein n=1 Tax=Cricetulus griseus TaxID=10029 RepID=G3HPH0_CRIGR|nr:hypothetical protein I79_012682 [Cricetulus griseus]
MMKGSQGGAGLELSQLVCLAYTRPWALSTPTKENNKSKDDHTFPNGMPLLRIRSKFRKTH